MVGLNKRSAICHYELICDKVTGNGPNELGSALPRKFIFVAFMWRPILGYCFLEVKWSRCHAPPCCYVESEECLEICVYGSVHMDRGKLYLVFK
jgi:hypothetical protein